MELHSCPHSKQHSREMYIKGSSFFCTSLPAQSKMQSGQQQNLDQRRKWWWGLTNHGHQQRYSTHCKCKKSSQVKPQIASTCFITLLRGSLRGSSCCKTLVKWTVCVVFSDDKVRHFGKTSSITDLAASRLSPMLHGNIICCLSSPYRRLQARDLPKGPFATMNRPAAAWNAQAFYYLPTCHQHVKLYKGIPTAL